jgi:hypothetical protein
MVFKADYDIGNDTRLYLYVIHNQLGVQNNLVVY